MSLRTVVLLLSLSGTLFAESALLSTEKEKILEHKKNEVDSGAKALRYNWIAPLNLTVSHTEQKGVGESSFSGFNQASASFDQDLFRSGGIYYAMRYADDKHGYDLLSWHEERDTLSLALFSAVLNIRKARLQCERSDYLLKNLEIALTIKRQQYEAGATDITELNDAIMARNSEQKNFFALRQSLLDYRAELKKYSDREAESITLPEFVVYDRETYLSQNYVAALAKRQSDVAYDTYKVTKAGYLPALSLNTQARYVDYHNAALSADDGSSYSVGLSLSMPLEYNSFDSVEEARAAMLRQKAEAADRVREEGQKYEQTRNLISRYEEENRVLGENLKLYDTLLEVAQKGYASGLKTGYDVQTLSHTRKIGELDIAINRLNIQLEMAKLHYGTYGRGE